VAVVDACCLLADETIHRLDDHIAPHHRDGLRSDPGVDFRSDQSTGDRVRVATDVDRRAFAHANAFGNVVGVEPLCGQRPEDRSFFGEPLRSAGVGTVNDALNQSHIVFSAIEVATTAKQQRLFDAIFEMPVLGFDIPVLVGTAGVGLLGDASVVIHQRRVTCRQRGPVGVIAHRGAE